MLFASRGLTVALVEGSNGGGPSTVGLSSVSPLYCCSSSSRWVTVQPPRSRPEKTAGSKCPRSN